MKSLDQVLLILEDQSLNSPHVVRGNSAIACQLHGLEPEFALTFGAPHVNVLRLVGLIGIKVETIRTDTKHGRYGWPSI
jgi:hypothetical protein